MKTRIIKRKGTLLSSVAMLSTAMLLTACGGDGGDSPVDDFGSNPGEGDNQALLYAYPDNGQGEISTAAPVVLRFSSAVNLGEAQNSITVYEGDAQTGTVVAVTPESVAKEPNNVLLQPDEDLKPNQTYTVVIEDLRLRKGTAKDQTLTFTTRPLHEGPKSLVVKDEAFEVSRRMPDGSAMEPVMDFSSFRFQFTQPIDRATATYGDSVTLTSSGGDTVDATLLIDGAYMTVDPEAEYLKAGETYTLDITADLASTYGETFGAESYTFRPKDSSPGRDPAILVQKLTQGDTSRLTGKPVNEVPVNGTLLGEDKNITQASAEVVRAELADVTTYTDVTPIRLPKGTVLSGEKIDPILIGGEVDAGFDSGDVTMTVLSDASGYLVPNPYAENNPDALRIVHLLMDVGIATSEARANGAFTQDLLHIELVGLAEVDPEAGVLNLDAVSVVEPNILGQEYGYGMLSFQLQSYKDQNSSQEMIVDTSPPQLQSWTQSDSRLSGTKDTIILNFDEPIAPSSINGNVFLYENQQPLPINYHVDGSAIVVRLDRTSDLGGGYKKVSSDYLKKNKENEIYQYNITVSGGVEDIEGNTSDELSLEFQLPTVVQNKTVLQPGPASFLDEVVNHSPVLLAVYPGFPCAVEPGTTDIANDVSGRCAGGFPGITDGTPIDNKEADDLIPIMNVSKSRPIVVKFSEPMSSSSIVPGVTFIVEKLNEDDTYSEVPGVLKLDSDTAYFYPETEWKAGEVYRYTLASSGYEIDQFSGDAKKIAANSNYECGMTAICDISGLPLQTQALGYVEVTPISEGGAPGIDVVREKRVIRTGPEMNAGGPNMVQYFKGAEPSSNVLQLLETAPVSDVNANLFSERDTSNNVFFGAGRYSFAVQEPGPTDISDPYTTEQYDPDGVIGAPNSVKLLSRFNTQPTPEIAGVNGANIGCSYQFPIQSFDNPAPLPCPEHKFSYLIGAMFAEVTNEISEQGLKVNLWPAQIMASSLDITAPLRFSPGAELPFPGLTGPQMLRLRYSQDSDGERTKPIPAFIKNTGDGLVLRAEVDLYVDAPYITEYAVGAPENTQSLMSYPITMNLEGAVSFLDDGRMQVEQYNINPVDIYLDLHNASGGNFGYADLFVPERGSRLNFVSDLIK